MVQSFTNIITPAIQFWLARMFIASASSSIRQSISWFMNRRIDGADPASFRGYYGGQCKWGSDHSHVWCFYVAAHPKVKPLTKADPSSFGFLIEEFSPYVRQYARDARYVYYYGRRVLGAEPGSFCSYEQDYFVPKSPSGHFMLRRRALQFDVASAGSSRE